MQMSLTQFKDEIERRRDICRACLLAVPCSHDAARKCECKALRGVTLPDLTAAPHIGCPRGKYEAVQVWDDSVLSEAPPPEAWTEAGKLPAPEFGPGTILHEMLEATFGAGVIEGCGCKAMIDRMNLWGVNGCRENMATIMDHLMNQRDKLSVSARTLAGRLKQAAALVAVKVAPEGVQREAVEFLINQAIDRAEADEQMNRAAST